MFVIKFDLCFSRMDIDIYGCGIYFQIKKITGMGPCTRSIANDKNKAGLPNLVCAYFGTTKYFAGLTDAAFTWNLQRNSNVYLFYFKQQQIFQKYVSKSQLEKAAAARGKRFCKRYPFSCFQYLLFEINGKQSTLPPN